MPVLHAQLLGPPQLDLDGRPLELSAGKARALFCYLLATRQVQSRDRLAGFFWPDVPERNALSSLRTALYDIRRSLGDGAGYLFVERTRVAFRTDLPFTLDVAALEQVGAEHDEPELGVLQAAIDAYQGPFLEGLSLPDAYDFDDWVFLERERLTHVYLSALCRLGDQYAAANQFERAIEAARRVLGVDALREDVHRQLMRYLARAGLRTQALAQYRACSELLERELGIAPLKATTELYERILAGDEVTDEAGGLTPVARAAHARGPVPSAVVDQRLPLVGRTAERRVLLDAWQRAVDGHGGVVLVMGEPGIGKTRLAAELMAEAAAAGAACLVGRCFEASASQPYGAVVDALRSGLSGLDVAGLGLPDVWWRELGRLVPEVLASHQRADNAPLDGVRDRDRLFEGVRAFLSSLSAQRPVVVLLEDIHWADETTLSLLSYLGRHAPTGRLLLTATYRREDLSHERRALVRGLAQLGPTVPLTAFSEQDTADLVGTLSEGATPPARFGRRLHRATGGNPFFLVETVRALFEQGSLSVTDGHWTTPAISETDDYAALPVPDSVGLIVDARLDQLTDDARMLLECAGVLRRDFAFDLAQAASGVPAPAALDALDVLVTRGLLREREAAGGLEVRYDFSHALVRDRVYQGLSAARRQYLHRQTAGLLESSLPPVPDRLAYHYLRGGVRDRACLWALKAGEAALAVYAFENALFQYKTARELAVTPAEAARALAGMGDAQIGLGQPAQAIESYSEALVGVPDAEGRAELHRRIGRAHERQGAFDRALDAYAEARRALPGKPASVAAIRLADGLATVYVRLGRYQDAAALCDESLSWLATNPDVAGVAEAEAWVRNTLGMAHLAADDYATAVANLERSLALKQALGDRLGEATLLNNLGVVHYHSGDDDQACDLYAASLAIKQEIGDSYGSAIALTNLALIETHLGRFDAAAAHLAEADTGAGSVGATWLTPEIRRVAAQRYMAVGDHAAALAEAEAALDAAEALGVPAFIGVAHRVLGQVKAAGFGDVEAADEHFETSLAVFEMLENNHELAKTHAAYGEVLAAVGQPAAADDHLRAAVEVFRRSGARGRLERIEPLLGGG